MNVEHAIDLINKQHNMVQTLGMEFVSTPEPDVCVGRMPVDERTRQPFGYLSGGASLALAETIAGVGSCSLCPDCHAVGLTVSANHVHAAPEGETVTATARIIHQGRNTHVWQVEIRDGRGTLISSASVTNFIIPKH